MKTLLFVLFFCLNSCLIAEGINLSKPVPVIRLPDGRVLKAVTFAKFNFENVLLRSSLGSIVVRYDALPDDVRAAAEQKRPGGAKWFPGDTSGNTETVTGQIFIQTRGNSSYKFGNVTVYAFDINSLTNLDVPSDQTPRLPKPIHQTTSDADGKFQLKVPLDRPYFIFAQATRLIVVGSNTENENYEWHVPVSAIRAGKQLLLSGENAMTGRLVEIEKVE